MHTGSDECAVRLKGDAVLTNELELVGDISTATRACEVLNFEDCAKLTEREGTRNGLFHSANVLRLNFSVSIGKFRAKNMTN